MAEIKYKYAYDENNKLVFINDYTKEESKRHQYSCVSCGKVLLPRAIGSKYRKAHFYHKVLVDCSGETYLHKLGKLLIKQKFDSNDSFNVSYPVTKECNNKNCTLRNFNCKKDRQEVLIDLKKYYDTCTEETNINGFVADLLLTNSQNPNTPPILIEICVTHPCEDEKRQSGLKIIEIFVKKEEDAPSLISNDVLREPLEYDDEFKELLYIPEKKKFVEFISFNKLVKEPLESEVWRYIFNPLIKINGYVTRISCKNARYKSYENSLVELNIVCSHWDEFSNIHALLWMYKYKNLRRCDICKFYYANLYEETPICRLSRKYKKTPFPEMSDAEGCPSFRIKDYYSGVNLLKNYHIEEVTLTPSKWKDEYRVIIAGSSGFKDKELFYERCNYYLENKKKTHNITVLSGTSNDAEEFIIRYSYENSLNVEPYAAYWARYGKDAAYIAQAEMIQHADALIAFWDGKGTKTGKLINSAKEKGLKVVVVKY